MSKTLEVFVPGTPVTQGSKVGFLNKHTGRVVMKEASARLPGWRMTITNTIAASRPEGTLRLMFPRDMAVGVSLDFLVSRPSAHHGAQGRVKPSAPLWPVGMRDDIDKLTRAVLDAITDSGVWIDDGQVVWVRATKNYATDFQVPGVLIKVGEMVPNPTGLRA